MQKTIASAENGFIFSMPERGHPLSTDTAFQRVLTCMFIFIYSLQRKYQNGALTNWFVGYLPNDVLKAVMPDLARLAEEASSEQVMAWISNAEKQQPYVKNHNAWGARYDVDKLVTSEGWKSLRRWGAQNGYVCSHIDF